MKTFKQYLEDELFLEEVSQEIDSKLNETEGLSRAFRSTVKSVPFIKQVVEWKKNPTTALTEEFVEFLTKLQLI